MRITTIAAAFAAFIATAAVPANASEIYRTADLKSPRVEQGFAALNWSGAYVGGFVGMNSGGWKDAGFDESASGYVFGAQAGADVQVGQLVAGVFADIASSSLTAKQVNTYTYQDWWYGIFTSTSTNKSDLTGYGSVGLRIGVAARNFLPYVKFGGALGQFTNTFSYESPFYSSSGTSVNLAPGYMFAGGFEYRFAHNVSVFAEARRTVFQQVSSYGVQQDNNELRFGANVRF